MLKSIKNIILAKNPFLLFTPFLLFYIVLAIVFHTNSFKGDETRYLIYADYFITGNAIPDFDYFGNGPGYSIILIPFVALHLPLIYINILNAFLYYFSIVLLFKIIVRITSFRKAFVSSFFLACYINLYEWQILIAPELFCLFLICLLVFCLVKSFENINFTKKHIFLSGFIFGCIALTKPIFGYVLICMFIGNGLLWVFDRKVSNYKKGLIILLVAFVTTTPYLIYTYRITNKVFYWSSYGGNNLYWMSTPFNGEYGDWFRDLKPYSMPTTEKKRISSYEDSIKLHHQKDYEIINKYSGMQQDDVFKRIAINNIKNHPTKFLKNCVYNVGRIFFNYPYSYMLQSPTTLMRLPFNGVVSVLILFCLAPTFKNWRKINFSIRFMLFLTFFYLGGSILGSAETRMFSVIVPILLTWIAFIIHKTIKIKDWAN